MYMLRSLYIWVNDIGFRCDVWKICETLYVVHMYRHEDMVARQENQHQLYLLSSSQTYQSNSCAGVCCIHPFAVLELHHSGGPKLGISYQNSQKTFEIEVHIFSTIFRSHMQINSSTKLSNMLWFKSRWFLSVLFPFLCRNGISWSSLRALEIWPSRPVIVGTAQPGLNLVDHEQPKHRKSNFMDLTSASGFALPGETWEVYLPRVVLFRTPSNAGFKPGGFLYTL